MRVEQRFNCCSRGPGTDWQHGPRCGKQKRIFITNPQWVTGMSIWALDKGNHVKQALILIEHHLGRDAFLLDQTLPLNPDGVYLNHPAEPGVRAYLFTQGQAENRYGLHLEYPPAQINNNLIDAYDNLTLRSLLNILAVHFDVADIKDLERLS